MEKLKQRSDLISFTSYKDEANVQYTELKAMDRGSGKIRKDRPAVVKV